MTERVAVVGAGISGLAAAHRLRTLLGPTASITVLEQRDRAGGVLRTVDLAGLPFDVGAEAFLARRPEVPRLLAELGLADALVHPTAARATIRAGGRTRPMPGGLLLGVPTSAARLSEVLSPAAVAAVAAESRRDPLDWTPGGDTGLGALLRSRFGGEAVDRLADPLLGGVYAGRVDTLGLRATVPALAAALDAGAPTLTAAADLAVGGASGTGPGGTPGSGEPNPLNSHNSYNPYKNYKNYEDGAPIDGTVRGAAAAGVRAGVVGPGLGDRGAPGNGDGRSGGAGAVGSGDPPAVAGHIPAGGPVFGAVLGGYRRLLDALLLAAAADVRLRTTVRAVDHGPAGTWRLTLGPTTAPELLEVDAVVLAVPAPAVARLLGPIAPAAAAAAGTIELASSAVIALAYDAVELPPTSGTLIASDEPLGIKGITHSSTKWAHLGTDGLVRLRASIGRFGEAATLQVDDAELVARVRADVATLTGVPATPVASHVQRWGGGLPQYGVGHLDRVAAIGRGLPDGLAVAGAALHGVGVPACIATAEAAAARLVTHLGRSARRDRREGPPGPRRTPVTSI